MNLKKYQIIGFIFLVILGTMLHFAYDFFNENLIVGYFTPVNESVWEHLKLIATPMLLYAILEYFVYGKDIDNFIPVRVLSILIGMIFIVCFFYTYTGILGDNFFILDIASFILASFIAYFFSYKLFNTSFLSKNIYKYISIFLLFLLILAFIFFTTNPPKINLFLDTTNNSYGIE